MVSVALLFFMISGMVLAYDFLTDVTRRVVDDRTNWYVYGFLVTLIAFTPNFSIVDFFLFAGLPSIVFVLIAMRSFSQVDLKIFGWLFSGWFFINKLAFIALGWVTGVWLVIWHLFVFPKVKDRKTAGVPLIVCVQLSMMGLFVIWKFFLGS